jgi:hypothetical protein
VCYESLFNRTNGASLLTDEQGLDEVYFAIRLDVPMQGYYYTPPLPFEKWDHVVAKWYTLVDRFKMEYVRQDQLSDVFMCLCVCD